MQLSLLAMISCSGSNKEQQDIVAEWVGKEIVIPEGLGFQVGNIPVDYDFDAADFKIVTYVDSTGCTGCKMRLPAWDKFLNSFKMNQEINVGILMLINTHDRNKIESIVNKFDYYHPIVIDSLNSFKTINDLSDKLEYQTFLLDNDNKIIAIGNPVYNPNIEKLYKKIINGSFATNEEYDNFNITGVTCPKAVVPVGVVNKNDTVKRVFRIDNTGDKTLHIQKLLPSCHCVLATGETSEILPGKMSDIVVKYNVDSEQNEFQQYVDVWFEERNNPLRLVLCGFIVNK